MRCQRESAGDHPRPGAYDCALRHELIRSYPRVQDSSCVAKLLPIQRCVTGEKGSASVHQVVMATLGLQRPKGTSVGCGKKQGLEITMAQRQQRGV